MMNVYWNGDVLPQDSVRVHPDDRGYLFGDGIYEVIRVYQGRCFEAQAHQRRWCQSADWIGLSPQDASLEAICLSLLEANECQKSDAMFYLQVSRGVAPRKHVFPEPAPAASVYGFVKPLARPDLLARPLARAACLPDRRWLDCHIKSISLLGAVMAAQKAHESDCAEAILHREGRVTEGSHTNVFAVVEGVLRTHPADHWILNGISRQVVIEEAHRLGFTVVEEAISLDMLQAASEVFLTGTTVEIWPVQSLDGNPVGDGSMGPVSRQLAQAFDRRVERLIQGS